MLEHHRSGIRSTCLPSGHAVGGGRAAGEALVKACSGVHFVSLCRAIGVARPNGASTIHTAPPRRANTNLGSNPLFCPKLFLALRLARLKGATRPRRTECCGQVTTISIHHLQTRTLHLFCCCLKPVLPPATFTFTSFPDDRHQQNACPDLPRCLGRHCCCHSHSSV